MAQPEKVFRLGSVSASIFRNETSDRRVFRSIQLQRSYRDGDQTKYSGSMNLSHLPNAIAALQMAFEYLSPLEAQVEQSGG